MILVPSPFLNTEVKGDRLDPRNWRPISLLNVDYKLASRVIAGRLLNVIHLVVDRDQTCGVPGRFIGENVALLHDVIDFASSSGTPIAILSLDQEKAFDRVDWSFMRCTLSAMGFGPSFISWVDLFYHCVRALLMSMVTFLLFSVFLEVLDRVVPRLPFCMS